MATNLTMTVKLGDVGRFEKRLRRRVNKRWVISVTHRWGRDAVRELRTVSEQKKIVFKRRFVRGWIAKRVNWHTMRVSNRAKHAIYVEMGRRPGGKMPPKRPIREWALAKGFPESAVYPIRRKIAVKGIKARPVLRSRLVRRRLGRMMRKLLDEKFSAALRKAAKR